MIAFKLFAVSKYMYKWLLVSQSQRLLFSVDNLVSVQILLPCKTFLANFAMKVFCACMNNLMAFQGAVNHKPCIANITLVRPFSCVSPHVNFQIIRTEESSLAHLTLKLLSTMMTQFVAVQSALTWERSLAYLADKGLFSRVDSKVPLQVYPFAWTLPGTGRTCRVCLQCAPWNDSSVGQCRWKPRHRGDIWMAFLQSGSVREASIDIL